MLTACSSDADHKTSEVIEPKCGYFDAEDCTCSGSLKLAVTNGKKECISTANKNVCLERDGGFQWALSQKDTSILQSCLVFTEKNSLATLPYDGRLVISVLSFNPSEKQKFVEWADKNKSAFSNLQPLHAPTEVVTGELLTVVKPNEKGIDSYMYSVLDSMMWRLYVYPYSAGALAPKLFASVDDLIKYIENPYGKIFLNNKNFGDNKALNALVQFYKMDWASEFVVSKSLSNEECKGSCLREYSLGFFNGFRGVLKEYLYVGSVYRTEIVLFNEQNSIVASMYLANKHPLILSVFDRQEKDLIKKVISYNVNGDIIYSYNESLVFKNLIEEQLKSTAESDDFKSLVGVCENAMQFDRFQMSNMSNRLVFGPNKELSYYGWLDTILDAKEFWTARLHTNYFGSPTLISREYAEHALAVSQIIVKDSNDDEIGLIPIGMDTCFDSPLINRMWSEIKKSSVPMKVVNVSAKEPVSNQTCEKMFDQHPMMTDQDVLWVVGAGNDSQSKPTGCPQHFAGRKNIIIVGATTGYSMSSISNYGKDWVDIAAPGDTHDGQNIGATSFATPRVTKVAARLFYLYPHFSVEQVKVSLLLGSKPIGWSLLPVRSGGELDEERSLNYAELINQGLSYKEAIIEIECGPKEFTCEDAKSKFNLVKEIIQ